MGEKAVVDDTDNSSVAFVCPFNIFYAIIGCSAFYLYIILK